MKTNITIFLVCFLCCSKSMHGQQLLDTSTLKSMNTTHDIRLGPWGPYSKKYAGISHIPDIAAGMRFDFFVMPGFYRNKVLIPNVNFESGYFPWQADSRQGSYTYRYELIWKDQVYVDVNYQIVDSSKVIVSIKCVNRTELPQSLALNLMASMNYPEVWPRFKLQKSSQDVWINAVDYKQIRFARQEPKDNLVTDGLMNGEMRNEGFIDGSALTKKFGQSAGNSLSYSIPAQFKKGYLTIFYRADIGAVSRISASGAIHQQIILEGDGKLKWIEIPFEWDGSGRLILTSLEGDGVELNGLLWSIKKDTKFAIEDNLKVVNPKVSTDFKNRQAILKYQHAPGYYGMSWGNSSYKIREIRNDELDVYFRKAIHNHVDSILKGNNQGHFENIFIRPLVLLAGSEKTFSCVLTHNPSMAAARQNMSAPKNIPQKAQKPFIGPTFLPESKTYAFSQKMLRAALLENIVYPIYTQRSYIRHYTPGKWWNSLYTWDSGFIALGLNELDINRAVECINAYTTEPGSQSAFIHHGAPVPVQVYAFFDLLNKTQSLPLLEYFYPRLKQYYSFLSGKLGSSSTGRLKSGLLNTWDYFYNSGGWDDYPAQVGIHQQRLESTVSPVITTAQCIRFAKILRMLAKKLNKNADAADYDIEIKAFSKSLQAYSWNEESGYFSYVRHDSSGKAIGAFRYKDGSDYNQGMDGAYPLFAGICTPAQQNILLKKLFSADHMWTPYGMGVVDRAAAYYLNDGYWNGSVWMPHQWFMWKTMLDLGKPELAMRISSTGLEVFKRETDHSYYTFEHYLSETGRGAGWHQFSGLSTPVLNWYNSTFKIGNVTTGFEILQEKSEFNSEFSNYEALLSFDDSTPAHARSMLICLNPSYQYQAMFNGRVIQHLQPYPGLLQVTLPATNVAGQLIIKIKGRK